MKFWRTTLFNLCFYPGSILYAVIFLPCLITVPTTIWGIHRWAYGVLWLLKVIVGLDYRVNLKHLLPGEPGIYACKHQSAWETIALWVLIPQSRFVMKKELYKIPFIGWWIRRAGNIGIDRKGGSAAIKQMIKEGKAHMEAGHNLIIFPEGTRTKIGETTEYLPGVTALAKFLKCPIVPIALNSGHYWKKNAYNKHPGTVTLSILEPIPANSVQGEELLTTLQTQIETEVKEISLK